MLAIDQNFISRGESIMLKPPGPLRLALGIAAIFCCFPLAGCGGDSSGGESSGRFIILTNVPDPFWDTCEAGAKQAAADLKLAEAGYSVVVEQNTKGPQGQIQRLREWAGDPNIRGVAISVTEPDNTALVDAMLALKNAGVPVITIDSDINQENPAFREARYGYIGTDNVKAGVELGKAARALLPEGAKYATFVGNKTQANAIERNTGFKQGAGEGFEQVDFLADRVDQSRARQNVHNAFSRNPDLTLLVGLWAYNTPAITDVVRDRGIEEDVTVLGFDAAPLALSAMKAGRVDALLVQDPYTMGYLGIKTLKALVDDDKEALKEVFPNYGSADNGNVHRTALKIVVPEKTSLTPDIFDENTEFIPLPEFRAWLDEYHLTGS